MKPAYVIAAFALGFLLATMVFQYRLDVRVEVHHHLHLDGILKKK